MAVNWGLLNRDMGGSALGYAQLGMKFGQMLRERNDATERKNALAAYAADPSNPKALQGVIAADPALGIKLRDSAAQDAETKRKAQFEQVSTMAKLLNHATDEPTYQQSLAAAKSLGLPLDGAPANFDANWVNQQRLIVKAFQKDGGQSLTTLAQNVMMTLPPEQRDPNNPAFTAAFNKAFIAEQTKTIPYTQGGGVAGYNPYTGQTNTIIAPNPGDKPTGAPVGAGPKPGAVVGGFRFKGGNPNDRSSWEPATGGASGNAGGNFRPVGIPGERVTSTRRSPARNKAVGGVTNSYHLSGLARDSVPPAGMTMAAYASELRRLNPGLDVINEGDHVHMEPR